MKKPYKTDVTPRHRLINEKIGDKEWQLEEVQLDVFDEVRLWEKNPRLQVHAIFKQVSNEEELAAALQETPGYDALRRSIADLGQMEAIYVWRGDSKQKKYVVFEGATRVAILRELSRKPKNERFRRVKAKVLPPNFTERDRAILLARIHVRGSGVRAWGRYIEAKFIHDHVTGDSGQAVMTMTEMANYMGKSPSWVTRLKEAYEFARRFIEHVDDEKAEQTAAQQFSTLEEISKASTIGPQLRDYLNSDYDQVRGEIFDMVKSGVFKEYRDARFIKDFHDDPEKWEQLKSGQENVAHRLANEIKTTGTSLKTKVNGLPDQVARALDRPDHGLGEDEVEQLYSAAATIETHLNAGVREFRIQLSRMTKTLTEVNLADVKSLSQDELDAFEEAVDYFKDLVSTRRKRASA